MVRRALTVLPEQRLRAVIEEGCVQEVSVLLVKSERHLPDFQHLRNCGRPPDEDEQSEIEAKAREAGLFGDFVVVADRVLIPRPEFDVYTEMSEFHVFRRRDVPYLMSMKTLVEVMRT